MRTVIGIGIAGAAGALARYELEGFVGSRIGTAFPWGTLVVNVTGAFVMGFLFVLLTERFAVAPWLRSSILIGLLGGYTTFSTLTLETYRLFEDGSIGLASLNVFGSVAAGMLAIYLGVVVGRAI
jgi:fluoride exporter